MINHNQGVCGGAPKSAPTRTGAPPPPLDLAGRSLSARQATDGNVEFGPAVVGDLLSCAVSSVVRSPVCTTVRPGVGSSNVGCLGPKGWISLPWCLAGADSSQFSKSLQQEQIRAMAQRRPSSSRPLLLPLLLLLLLPGCSRAFAVAATANGQRLRPAAARAAVWMNARGGGGGSGGGGDDAGSGVFEDFSAFIQEQQRAIIAAIEVCVRVCACVGA